MNEEDLLQLRKDAYTVMEWKESGKALTEEQRRFADRVVTKMIEARNSHKAGAQLVSKSKIDFIKGIRSDAGGATAECSGTCNQDVVSNGPADKDGKYKRKTAEGDVEVGAKVDTTVSKSTVPDSGNQILNTKDKNIVQDQSSPITATPPRQTPDIQNIQQRNIPKNQKEGEVTSVADSKTDPKETSSDSKEEISIEEIGHNPNLPMPRMQAEGLINNAKYGVKVGMYTNLKEAISRILGNKEYAEFTDTPEKIADVLVYLNDLAKIEPIPVA